MPPEELISVFQGGVRGEKIPFRICYNLFKMKRIKSLPLLLPILTLSVLLNAFFVIRESGILKDGQDQLEGRVVRIIDGDTFDLERDIRVRLAGAQAPEYPEGCLAAQAKQRLEELILGKQVEIEVIEEDNFGRQVGFVKESDLLIDQVLVEEGLAQVKGEQSRYGPDLLTAQETAKKAARGIWSSLCTTSQGCLIKGNVRRDRGTKVYHLPGCYNYEKIVVNEREGDLWFCSEQEAQKAGFRKSEDCP